jgi:tRNA-modifying protein YgfZ
MHEWLHLPHLTGLTIHGEDALPFCQSQFSADVHDFAPDRWHQTAWCNSKGRCVTVILAKVHECGVDLIVPAVQGPVLDRLKVFTIGRRLTFSSPRSVAGSFNSESADQTLAEDPLRALGLLETPAASDTKALIDWQIADLCLPLPWLSPPTSGRYLPQFLGLDKNQGLSYKKGCFPGQEVIARVHYLGSVKYCLSGFVIEGELVGVDSTAARLIADAKDQAIDILDLLQIDHRLIGLAVRPVELPDDGRVRLETADGALSGQMTPPKGLCYYRSDLSAK